MSKKAQAILSIIPLLGNQLNDHSQNPLKVFKRIFGGDAYGQGYEDGYHSLAEDIWNQMRKIKVKEGFCENDK